MRAYEVLFAIMAGSPAMIAAVAITVALIGRRLAGAMTVTAAAAVTGAAGFFLAAAAATAAKNAVVANPTETYIVAVAAFQSIILLWTAAGFTAIVSLAQLLHKRRFTFVVKARWPNRVKAAGEVN